MTTPLGNIELLRNVARVTAAALSHALELAPQNLEARKQYGMVLTGMGRNDEAMEQWKIALEQAPNDVPLLKNIAGLYVSMGRMAEGLAVLQQAIRLDETAQTKYAELAQALMSTRRLSEARQIIEAGLATAPDDVALLKAAAKLFATSPDPALRDPALALKYAEKACELTNMSDADALDALGAAQFNVGRLGPAVESAQRALELAVQQQDRQRAARIQNRLGYYRAQLAAQPASSAPASQP